MATHLAKIHVLLYLRDKRARKRARRKHREWKAELIRRRNKASFDAVFGSRSRIAAMLSDCATGEGLQRKGSVKFSLPSSFSMIDSPESTLRALAHFARAIRADRLRSVYVDFSEVQQYDLGANGLLDVLVDEVSIEARTIRRIIQWRGNFPTDPAHVRFVRAMGVIKRLKVVQEYPSRDDDDHLTLFDSRCRHYIQALRPREADKKSRVTAKFSDHINRCLLTIGRELTAAARGQLCAYVGEVIDNAEQHAGMCDWAIQGYLDTLVEEPMCEVVIFNFGRTIAKTFEGLPHDGYTRRQIQPYIDWHTDRGFFTAGWRKEDLYTLISLQGNVSSKNTSECDTRGNGTVDLIDFFQRVHAECSQRSVSNARMVIVSGSTYILFDGKYTMRPNDAGLKIIAFNEKNDLGERPDRAYVRKLDGVAFPGTLIGLKFPLSTVKSTVETMRVAP